MNWYRQSTTNPGVHEPLGECVATPRPGGHPDRYIGIDHVRCSHPTPVADGYHPCAGDRGCPLRLKVRQYCPYHEDLAYDLNPADRWAALMGDDIRQTKARMPWA